jgi:hypothetical protein
MMGVFFCSLCDNRKVCVKKLQRSQLSAVNNLQVIITNQQTNKSSCAGDVTNYTSYVAVNENVEDILLKAQFLIHFVIVIKYKYFADHYWIMLPHFFVDMFEWILNKLLYEYCLVHY